MPISVTTVRAAGTAYGAVFVDGPRDVEQITVDMSVLTYADASGGEVDADGYLIPGVLLKSDGTLADGTTDEAIYGVVIEATKVPGLTTVAADATVQAASDFPVAVARGGLLNRDMIEDNLKRAISANELAAISNSNLLLTAT